jgi:two-component system OmpR family sensor kinase
MTARPDRGVRWVWRRTPLWARLVAGALALVAIGLTVTGIIGVSLLRSYLYEQNGQQLRAFGVAVADGRRAKGTNLNCGGLPNDNATELVAGDGQQVLSSCPAWVQGSSQTPDVPARDVLDAEAHSRSWFILTNKNSPKLRWEVVIVPMQYQVNVQPRPSSTGAGDASTGTHAEVALMPGYVLVATNLSAVDATVAQMTRVEIAVGSVAAAALVLIGYAIVRTALRPLTQIEDAAEAISGGELSRRVDGGHPKTETGRLAAALNGMLGQIETAFSARERSEAAARDSERRMRRFVADASHELRTPLTSIRGFAELYRQGAAEAERVPELISRIEQEALRMGVLVEDLLLLARMDQQRPPARDRVHLAGLAADAVTGARVRDPGRTIRLEVEHQADREPVVVGDETRLRQALDNLLDNALRHTPKDARVDVHVRPAPEAGPRQYYLEVADTGPGLTEDAAAHVFERFYRADPARTRTADGDRDRGSGLGLAIVAAIAEAHGGAASVHTSPGKGAVFRLMLPAALDQPPES